MLSDADGADIVNALITLESPTCNSLNDLIARKASISALGAGGAPPRIANPHARRAAAGGKQPEVVRQYLLVHQSNRFTYR
ncbi:hypothetical protein H0H87_005692 [Tephrocybe sp. NHM501043]|nr:hypothetical protein H0H87_005692 [Tephrocybe sp. NHM501043]